MTETSAPVGEIMTTEGCLCDCLLCCLDKIKVWTANPQQFVEDEDDDTFSYSVRISAQDLLLVRLTQNCM